MYFNIIYIYTYAHIMGSLEMRSPPNHIFLSLHSSKLGSVTARSDHCSLLQCYPDGCGQLGPSAAVSFCFCFWYLGQLGFYMFLAQVGFLWGNKTIITLQMMNFFLHLGQSFRIVARYAVLHITL